MTEPEAKSRGWDARFVVKRGECLPKLMQPPLPANRFRGAAMPCLIDALPAVQTGAKRQSFKRSKEVTIGLSGWPREDQHRRAPLLPRKQRSDKRVGDRYRPLLFVFDPEAHLGLGANLHDHSLGVYVLPDREHYLLLAQARRKEELEGLSFFWISGGEESVQLIRCVGLDLLLVILRLVSGTKHTDYPRDFSRVQTRMMWL